MNDRVDTMMGCGLLIVSAALFLLALALVFVAASLFVGGAS